MDASVKVHVPSVWSHPGIFITVGHLDCSVQVLRKHRRSKTVECVVSLSDNVVLVLEFDYNANETEYLFPYDLHIWGGAREDCWLDKISLGS